MDCLIGSDLPSLISMTKELSLDVGFRYVSLLHGAAFGLLMLDCSQP